MDGVALPARGRPETLSQSTRRKSSHHGFLESKGDSMMTRRLTVATALFAFLALPFLANAAPGRGGNPADILHNPRALARYLKLTPAQIETARQLAQTLHNTTKPLYDQIEPLEDQLHSQL